MSMMIDKPVCRAMRLEEADDLATLLAAAYGRPQYAPTVARLSGMPNATIHVLEAGGALRAAAALVDYGGVAYLGIVGTDPAAQGRGFGRQVVETALASVPAGTTILLDASVAGAPLYEKLGFRDLDAAVVFEIRGSIAGPPLPDAAPFMLSDLSAVAAYDAGIFGADRGTGLAALLRERAQGVICRRGGHIIGYGLRLAGRIGPVLADAPETASALVAALSAGLPDDPPTTIIVPSGNAPMQAYMRGYGAREDRRLRHMWRGGPHHPSDRSRIGAVASFHLG